MSNKSNEKMDGEFETNVAEKAVANTGKPARPAKPKASLGRETKVGLGVVAALLVIFVVVLAMRLRGGADEDLAQNGSPSLEDTSHESGSAAKKTLPSEGGTVLPAQNSNQPSGEFRGGNVGAQQDERGGTANEGGSLYANKNEWALPPGNRSPYLPAGTAGDTASGNSQAADNANAALENPLRSNQPPTQPNAGGAGAEQPGFLSRGGERVAAQDEPNNAATGIDAGSGQAATDETSTDDRKSSPAGSGISDPFQAGQTTGAAFSDPLDPQDNSPPFKASPASSGSTASETGGTAEPNLFEQATAGQGDAVPADQTDVERASGKLAPVDDFPAKTAAEARDSSIAPIVDGARTAKGVPFGARPKSVVEPAKLDETIVGDAPAPLRADSMPTAELYEVQANDTYWTIAQKAYGSGAYFKALYEHNRRHLAQADKLRPGAQLRLPDEATLQRLYPTLCPRPQRASVAAATQVTASLDVDDGGYVVHDGDTLYEIARRQLGKGSRWAEVYDLNRDLIGRPTDRLEPGTRLRLPADEGLRTKD